MSNQRVIVLTDDEIGAYFHPPVHRPDADCSCDDCVAERSLRAKLRAVLEHPEGITEDMVDRGARRYARGDDGRAHCSGSPCALCMADTRRVLEAALCVPNEDAQEAAGFLFPGDGERGSVNG